MTSKKSKNTETKFDSRTLYKESRCKSAAFAFVAKNTDTNPDIKKSNCKLYEEFLKQNSMPTVLSTYKKATLCKTSNDWFASYYYINPDTGNYKRFKVRFNINRIKNHKDKLLYGKVLVDFLNEKLENGFNPFAFEKEQKHDVDFHVKTQLIKVIDALGANATRITQQSYRDCQNRFFKFIDEKQLHTHYLNSLTIDHSKQFKKWMLYEKNLAVKTCNNTLSHISLFYDHAIEMGLTTTNPFKVLPKAKKRDKVARSKDKFEPFTNEEIALLFSHLKQTNQQQFINFLAFIYYAFARPIEIMRLKIEDIELERELIAFKSDSTKNGKSAYVQIVPPLLELIKKMDLHKYPKNYFLFSDNYMPGLRQLNKSNPSKWWRLKIKGVLGLQKNMYALKHTGNIEYLLQNKGNADLKWQQMQNRHRTSAMTDQYNRDLGAYFLDMEKVNFRLII